MKRKLVSKIIIVFTVIIALLTSFAACNAGDVQEVIKGGGITQLPAPTGLRIESGNLSWNPVEYASKYTVSIDGREYYCDDYSYPLTNVSDGEHSFKVLANGDGIAYKTSAFSEPLNETISGGAKASTGYYGQFDELTKNESFLGYGFDVINSSVFSDKYVTTSFPIFKTEELFNQRLLKVDSKSSYIEEIKSSSMEDFMQQWNVNAKVNTSWGGKRIGGSVDVSAKYKGGVEHAKSKYFHCISIYNQKFYIVLQSDLSTYRQILSDGFIEDLYSDMSPASLFSKYGTHFITSAVMGGKINSYYLYTSEEEKSYHDVSAKVSVEVRALPTKVNVQVSGGYKEEASSQNIDIKNTLEVIGGGDFGMLSDEDIPANYAEWEKSLDNHASLMGIKDSSSLIPIWDLIETTKDNGSYTWDYGDGRGEVSVSRSEQLQAYFMKYGIDSWNTLMEDSGLPEIITPTDITSVIINGAEPINDEYEIYAGTSNAISFGYIPENATGFTKSASLATQTEYAEIDNKSGLNLNVDVACPHNTVLQLVLSYGNVRKTVKVRVIKRYTVSFESNLGSEVPPYNNVKHGRQIEEPQKPTREGYLFKGWYKDHDFAEDSLYLFGEEAVTEDFTLYAKWEKYYPAVDYIHNIDYSGEKQEKVLYGSKLTLADLTEYGYDFKGYFADSEMLIPFDKDTEIKTETMVYVKWEKKTFTVTFETNGGSEVDSQYIKYLEKATKPTTAKAGSTFSNWYKDEDLNFVFDFSNEIITQDITLYAGWTANPVTVCFDTHGGNEISEQTIDYGTTLGENLFTPEKTGYTFKGWYLEENYVNRVYKTTAITADCTLHAKWEANTYVVVFNPNGADGTMSSQNYFYDEQKALNKNLFTKVGYTFAGWAISSEDEVKYVDEQIVKNLTELNEITLYAKWKLNKYTVKFDSNGGNGKMESQIFDYGEKKALSKNLYVKEKRIFDGWALSSDGAVKYCDEQIVKNLAEKGEVTLFAVWKTIYEWANNEHTELYFGSYPQTDVTSNVSSMLNGYVAVKPTTENSNGWTSYGYYINGSNATDYMWYKDVDVESDGFYDYRAVYFTSYRPYWTSYSSSTSNTYQDENGYYTSNVYWFKYEPIKWRVLASEDGYATLLCSMAIDSQDYNYTYNSRTIDGKTVYANNYEYSSIRAWLNDTFYNTAFNSLQKSIIETVEVDNSARSTSPDTTVWNNGVNNYACNNTFDKVWLLSEQEVTTAAYGFNTTVNTTDAARQMQSSDYAKAQGCWQSTSDNYRGCCWWWLRSPYYNDYDATRGVYSDGIADYGDEVNLDSNGVLPALTIRL